MSGMLSVALACVATAFFVFDFGVVVDVIKRVVGGWVIPHASDEIVEECKEVVKTRIAVDGDFNLLWRDAFDVGVAFGVADFSD